MSSLLAILLSGVVRFSEILGITRTLSVGAFVGRAWFRLRGPRTRRVREQLGRAFPELSVPARRDLEERVFVHLGRGLSELVLLMGRYRASMFEQVRILGLEHLRAARASSRNGGVIITCSHLGNWELCGASLGELDLPFSAVYRGLRSGSLANALTEIRTGGRETEDSSGVSQIEMGPRAGIEFVKALKAGRCLLVLLDQRARRNEGLFVQFFDQPARTRSAPLKLADRMEVPVLWASTRRDEDDLHHTVIIHPPLQLEPGSSHDATILQRNLQVLTNQIELEIRKTPEQWIWTHRRW